MHFDAFFAKIVAAHAAPWPCGEARNVFRFLAGDDKRALARRTGGEDVANFWSRRLSPQRSSPIQNQCGQSTEVLRVH
jgi:hypothetical protein